MKRRGGRRAQSDRWVCTIGGQCQVKSDKDQTWGVVSSSGLFEAIKLLDKLLTRRTAKPSPSETPAAPLTRRALDAAASEAKCRWKHAVVASRGLLAINCSRRSRPCRWYCYGRRVSRQNLRIRVQFGVNVNVKVIVDGRTLLVLVLLLLLLLLLMSLLVMVLVVMNMMTVVRGQRHGDLE